MDQSPLSAPAGTTSQCRIGLVLPGGGARGAYQVGVLKAIAEILPRRSPSPFRVLSGTSAGAINTTVIASRAHLFHVGIAELEHVWRNFRSSQVFMSDNWTMIRNGAHWLRAVLIGGTANQNPLSLLDNTPLRNMLQKRISFSAIQRSIDRGYLDAVAVTVAGYTSARSVSFYQSASHVTPWNRVRRIGRPAEISLDHLMASIAVPIVFPPVLIGREYFGDGAMRQATPLSPAIHLGVDRIFVIGVRNEVRDPDPAFGEDVPYPSIGRVVGYMLDALFMDGLSTDLERLIGVNLMLHNASSTTLKMDTMNLRSVDAFVILPTQDVREIASRHVKQLPRSVRILLRGLGALNRGGMQLASYLLFESGFTRELIDLGYRDAMNRRQEIEAFLSGEPLASPARVTGWRDLAQEYTGKFTMQQLSGKEQGS